MIKEKYAIAANGPTKVSVISDLAARAPFYLLFDQSGNFLEALKNPLADTPGRAAPQAAQLLAQAGVTKTVAGKFGHKMVSELISKGIDHLESKGTVESAITGLLEK